MTTDEHNQEDIFSQFEQLVTQLGSLNNQIVHIRQNIKLLEKNVKSEMKLLKKESNKPKPNPKPNRIPSGFAKPCKISKELCAFMNKPDGTELARTDVTRALNKYIKENKLQNALNSRIIMPDHKLKTLLDIKENEELTYFNLQKYMNRHFNPISESGES